MESNSSHEFEDFSHAIWAYWVFAVVAFVACAGVDGFAAVIAVSHPFAVISEFIDVF
jgi:hypothetical protein